MKLASYGPLIEVIDHCPMRPAAEQALQLDQFLLGAKGNLPAVVASGDPVLLHQREALDLLKRDIDELIRSCCLHRLSPLQSGIAMLNQIAAGLNAGVVSPSNRACSNEKGPGNAETLPFTRSFPWSDGLLRPIVSEDRPDLP